jgi:TPR repeat protein
MFKAAAECGDWTGEEGLGRCFYHGHGVSQSYKHAFDLLVKSLALKKSAEACFLLGNLYLNGYYVKKDEEEAYCLFGNAYDIISQKEDLTPDVTGKVYLQLGDCRLRGTGTEKDAVSALLWYQFAEYVCISKEDIDVGDNLKDIHMAIKGEQKARNKLLRRSK